MKLAGVAAPFNSWSEDLGGFREQIAPGAFRATLKERNVFAVYSHNMERMVGSTRAGTLRLREDRGGLSFTVDLPSTALGNELHTLVHRGDLQHMSFAFRVRGAEGEKWEEGPGGLRRTLLDVDLFEVSIVCLPAYPASRVSVRSVVAEADSGSSARAARNKMTRRLMASRLRLVA